MTRRWLLALAASMLFSVASSSGRGAPDTGADASEGCNAQAGACQLDLADPQIARDDAARAATREAAPPSGQPTPGSVRLLFFWGHGCPHCESAKPFLEDLGRSDPHLVVERIEVRRDDAGRRRFVETMQRLGARTVGIPTFVVGDEYEVGYSEGAPEDRIRALVARARTGPSAAEARPHRVVDLPWLGRIDPAAVSLPVFTLLVGLVDGINPCAMWVLLVLLGILVHVKSRKRLLLFGGTFVVASGVVYFVFMTAWAGLFALAGLSRLLTLLLGFVVLVMGLVNLKELVWFKAGPSLTIPDKAKPGLYRRMRSIAGAASFPAAFLGIVVLAFLVNLVELGCTLGLPAVYTRILTLRTGLSVATRYAYLGLYNLAYVVPLAVIVAAYALTLHRVTLSERGARILKGFSGALLVSFGLLFLLAPDLLR